MMQTKKIWTSLTAGAVMMGMMSSPVFATEVVVAVEEVFTKTVDNFIVLYDSSSSMASKYAETAMTKIQAERKVLAEANNTLPNLDWNAGIFIFTPGEKVSLHKQAFQTVLPMGPYNKATFGKAVESLPVTASGPTLLQNGLVEVDTVINGLKGKTAVFLFTDGTYSADSRQELKPLALAKTLVRKYDTCIYAISGATGATEKALVKAMSELNECSMVIPFDKLLGSPGYTTGGLYTAKPKVIAVDVADDILFDFNKSELKDADIADLKELGTTMEKKTNLRVVLAGFTDGVGSEGYNMELSKKRAETVRDYLLANFKIDKDRLTLNWYGKADPIASNQTDEGRALNRRVAIVLTGM
jgi:OOP family OmpA-OmpF porin